MRNHIIQTTHIMNVRRKLRRKNQHQKIRHSRPQNPTNEVPQKKVVHYLDVHLDFKLNYNEHVKLQIDQAQKVFIANKRIFYSKNLDKKVKLLLLHVTCYKLLLRPILIYGCPIWFNISASTMEKICCSKYIRHIAHKAL